MRGHSYMRIGAWILAFCGAFTLAACGDEGEDTATQTEGNAGEDAGTRGPTPDAADEFDTADAGEGDAGEPRAAEVLRQGRGVAKRVIAEVYSAADALAAQEAGFDGVVLKGNESGGRIGRQLQPNEPVEVLACAEGRESEQERRRREDGGARQGHGVGPHTRGEADGQRRRATVVPGLPLVPEGPQRDARGQSRHW